MEPAQLDLKAGAPGAVPVDYVMAQRPRARNLASQSSLSFLYLLTFFRSCSKGIERIELKEAIFQAQWSMYPAEARDALNVVRENRRYNPHRI